MTPGKVYGTSKLEKKTWKIVEIFFSSGLEKRNPPKFENDLKWPSAATVKS